MTHSQPLPTHWRVPVSPPLSQTAPTSHSQAPSSLQDLKVPLQLQVPPRQLPDGHALSQQRSLTQKPERQSSGSPQFSPFCNLQLAFSHTPLPHAIMTVATQSPSASHVRPTTWPLLQERAPHSVPVGYLRHVPWSQCPLRPQLLPPFARMRR